MNICSYKGTVHILTWYTRSIAAVRKSRGASTFSFYAHFLLTEAVLVFMTDFCEGKCTVNILQ